MGGRKRFGPVFTFHFEVVWRLGRFILESNAVYQHVDDTPKNNNHHKRENAVEGKILCIFAGTFIAAFNNEVPNRIPYEEEKANTKQERNEHCIEKTHHRDNDRLDTFLGKGKRREEECKCEECTRVFHI